MNCQRCGKHLTDIESIDRGYGPVCWAYVMEIDVLNRGDVVDDFISDLPISQHGFVFQIENGRPRTNVPVHVRHHSPSGFSWGYGGSGPADLALNIVEHVLRRLDYNGATITDTWDGSRIYQQAWALHQEFKWAFIAPLPQSGGSLALEDVACWVKQRTLFQMELFA